MPIERSVENNGGLRDRACWHLLNGERPSQAHGEGAGAIDLLQLRIGNGSLNLVGHPIEELGTAKVAHGIVDFVALHVDDAHALGGGLVAVQLDDGNTEGGPTDVESQIGSLLAAGGELVIVRRQHADVAGLEFGGKLVMQAGRHLQQLGRVQRGLEQTLDLVQQVVHGAVVGSQGIAGALPRRQRGEDRVDEGGQHGETFESRKQALPEVEHGLLIPAGARLFGPGMGGVVGAVGLRKGHTAAFEAFQHMDL